MCGQVWVKREVEWVTGDGLVGNRGTIVVGGGGGRNGNLIGYEQLRSPPDRAVRIWGARDLFNSW